MSYERLLKIMSSQDRSMAGGLSRLGLSILEPGYRTITSIRNRMFDSALRKPKKLPRPVISVGNLTTGGTGKTPMVIELVKRLQMNDVQPAVLLRGYRAGIAGSDEAAELQNELGSEVAVVANPNRSAGAKLALKSQPETDLFVLDDGFQHRQVARNLDIVLVDATQPWGFNHVLPRGLLRESKAGLRRADAVIITRVDRVSVAAADELGREIEHLHGMQEVARAAYEWAGYRDQVDNELAVDSLMDKKVATVCGIGNPGAFAASVAEHVGQVVDQTVNDDHHEYGRAELYRLIDLAKSAGAEVVVTTEKDWVKLRQLIDGQQLQLPMVRPRLAVRFVEGEQAVERLLSEVVCR